MKFDSVEEASSSIAKLSSTSISKQAGAMLATFWQKIKRSFEVLVCSLWPLRFRWVLAGRGADFDASGDDFEPILDRPEPILHDF